MAVVTEWLYLWTCANNSNIQKSTVDLFVYSSTKTLEASAIFPGKVFPKEGIHNILSIWALRIKQPGAKCADEEKLLK